MSVPSDINEWLSWVQGTTVNDIVIDYSSNKLIAIKDFTFREITVAALRQFCVHHQITAYKNKTKEMTGALIIQYARTKSITDALYPCSKEDGKDEDVTEDDKLKNKKGKKKRHKSTAPNSISKPGTYYRIINTYMVDQNCPDVVNIGSNPTMADLDSRRFLHKSIYDKLLLSYHDSSCQVINGFAFPEVLYFENAGVPAEITNNFDVISSQDFSDVMGYLNFHYQVAHRKNKSSGNHDDFEKFVGNRPYLLYYHLWLLQVPSLQNLAVPTLPDAVMRDSLSPSIYSSSESAASNLSKKRGAGGNNKAVMSVLEEIGRNNRERTRYMKERNDYNEVMIQQNAKMLKMADEKHAVRREMDLSKLLLMHKQSLHDAQQELRRLQASQDYDTDSSETREAKCYVCVLSNRYSNTIQQLENHDI